MAVREVLKLDSRREGGSGFTQVEFDQLISLFSPLLSNSGQVFKEYQRSGDLPYTCFQTSSLLSVLFTLTPCPQPELALQRSSGWKPCARRAHNKFCFKKNNMRISAAKQILLIFPGEPAPQGWV